MIMVFFITFLSIYGREGLLFRNQSFKIEFLLNLNALSMLNLKIMFLVVIYVCMYKPIIRQNQRQVIPESPNLAF